MTMTGSMRDRTRSVAIQPPLPNHNEDARAGSARNNIAAEHAHFRERDTVSRLSEGLEPIHTSDQPPLKQPHDVLGVHVKDAIETINRLEGLGLQKLSIPLPKIIVLGEQSTGKSSVIEAISGIQTPRSTGTCTRCPLFIKLESSASPRSNWRAHVTLRRSFNWDGKIGRGQERRFAGWYPAPEPHTVDFMSTDNPQQLEQIISRAQQATVSPLTDYKEFTKDTVQLEGIHQCRFSPNIACIYISCPGLPALSFYDLPGIIGQAEDPQDVKFVKELVMEYVRDPEALLLITCSMENDIANSTAGGIARQLKATDRCIGVLTKPDRLLPASCHDILHDVYEGKKLPFGHGYFVVRNLGQDQLDQRLTHEQARDQERQFFEQQEPFATAFRSHEARFGTWNLQAFLSGKLAEQITKKLPIIQSQMQSRLSEVENSLKQYPEPPTHNAVRIISDLVLEFSQNVRLEIEGNFPHIVWKNSWKSLRTAFFGSLISLKPVLVTSGGHDKGIFREYLTAGNSADRSIVLPDPDDDDGSDEDLRMSEAPEKPTKKRKTGDTPGPSPLKAAFDASKSASDAKKIEKVPIADFSAHKTKFELDVVAEYLAESSNTGIPGLLDYRVTHKMTLQPLENWQMSIDDFFDKLEARLRSRLETLFNDHFKRWAGTALYDNAWKIVTEMLNANLQQQRTIMAAESLKDETNGMFVFPEEIYSRDKDVVLETYRQARYRARLKMFKHERMCYTGKHMTPVEEARILKDVKLAALLQTEKYESEIDTVAGVTTYYMMAARRFYSSICMRVESQFFKQLRTQLRNELDNVLGIHHDVNGRRIATELLEEDPQRERQRQVLLSQRNALMQGQRILRDLQQRKYGGETMSQSFSASASDDSGADASRMPTPISDGMDEI